MSTLPAELAASGSSVAEEESTFCSDLDLETPELPDSLQSIHDQLQQAANNTTKPLNPTTQTSELTSNSNSTTSENNPTTKANLTTSSRPATGTNSGSIYNDDSSRTLRNAGGALDYTSIPTADGRRLVIENGNIRVLV
ncbi:hypothetical protein FQN54_004776 [Arachnomyces sp. PD_36]|nr:hypothetical protein FQN54_004776 [Arachnomyces sp. PD_36]